VARRLLATAIDVVVYTNPTTLKHKQEDGFSKNGMACYWEFRRFPQKLREEHLENLRKESLKQYHQSHAHDPQPPAPAPLTIYDFLGKIYFAVKGFVVGSFDIDNIDEDENTIFFYSETWELEAPVPCKAFRGFRYKWW
jgi:hypothetical protein